MSIPRRPNYYIPDEFFDFGFAGEHPVTFTSWISECGPNEQEPVKIVSVMVNWTFTDPCRQSTDITEQVMKYHRVRYEDEIRENFRRAKDADWNGDIGA